MAICLIVGQVALRMMNVNLVFDYPVWVLLLCLLCGLVYSGMLYYKSGRSGFSLATKWMLAVFRFITISILALLLLSPLVERKSQYVEEPLLIFVQDNSASLLLVQDTVYYRNDYLPGLYDFLEKMSDAADPRLYTFGESFSGERGIDFSERVTHMSEVFHELDMRYSNRNIGAVVMAGDGLYNRGANPLYAAGRVHYPVYTIAMGDTLPRRDLILKRVNHNEITYLGNRFPVEIDIEALQSDGLNSRLSIRRNGEELFGKNITFTSGHHVETISLHLEADESGMQRYRASLEPVEGEVSLDNNYRDFFIDVIDGRQRVLILANSPHPDVGAIRESLVQNDHFEIDVSLVDQFQGSVEAYDLLILHQIPSVSHPSPAILSQAEEESTPILFVLGKQTDLEAFNRLSYGLDIQARSEALEETLPAYNQAFSLFSLQEATRGLLDYLPPLYSPFGTYALSGGAQVLFYQQIGQVMTERPLVVFFSPGDRRTGVITGEGLWRWRLHTFMRREGHHAFDDLISRMIQYLALKEDRRLFRIQTAPLVYENEVILFEAELYNPVYELINEPEIRLEIFNEDGISFPYVMGRTAKAYRLDAGIFEPGSYTWEAQVQSGGERYIEQGMFTVSPLDLEGLRTTADHGLLFQIAENTGARMFFPDQWDDLRADILAREDLTPRMYAQKDFTELINLRAIFFIALLLLTLEWLIRKRSGSY